jgi:hypothetical protein
MIQLETKSELLPCRNFTLMQLVNEWLVSGD